MAIGVALGDFTAMTLSLFGVGALLKASATVFMALKWIGAAYLIYLGFKLFRAGGTLDVKPIAEKSSVGKMIAHSWLVTALNPKGITFFVAFVPQFVNTAAPFVPQAVIFELTFICLAFANALGYAFVASKARALVSNPRAIKVLNRAGGTLLMGAGVAVVATRS
jgi:threonine/homoserine/homoserine lactone efflux protein